MLALPRVVPPAPRRNCNFQFLGKDPTQQNVAGRGASVVAFARYKPKFFFKNPVYFFKGSGINDPQLAKKRVKVEDKVYDITLRKRLGKKQEKKFRYVAITETSKRDVTGRRRVKIGDRFWYEEGAQKRRLDGCLVMPELQLPDFITTLRGYVDGKNSGKLETQFDEKIPNIVVDRRKDASKPLDDYRSKENFVVRAELGQDYEIPTEHKLRRFELLDGDEKYGTVLKVSQWIEMDYDSLIFEEQEMADFGVCDYIEFKVEGSKEKVWKREYYDISQLAIPAGLNPTPGNSPNVTHFIFPKDPTPQNMKPGISALLEGLEYISNVPLDATDPIRPDYRWLTGKWGKDVYTDERPKKVKVIS